MNQKSLILEHGSFSSSEEKAIFSRCMNYRYTLYRKTGPRASRILFIMLNPSTADDNKNDPTVRRCIGYAQDWEYGQMAVCNLFAYRSTDPNHLYDAQDPEGPENDRMILDEAKKAHLIICAWGTHGLFRDRHRRVLNLLWENNLITYSLKVTKAGYPSHPLYLKKDLNPEIYMDERDHFSYPKQDTPEIKLTSRATGMSHYPEDGGWLPDSSSDD